MNNVNPSRNKFAETHDQYIGTFNNAIGSSYWINSHDKLFSDIQKSSKIKNRWLEASFVYETKYKDNVLKPINMYAYNFYSKPKLKINNDLMFLEYYSHAEIWIEMKNKFVYALDKTHQRQFYPSSSIFEIPEKHYRAIYKFYLPWDIDYDIDLDIINIKNSPVTIFDKQINFKKIDKGNKYIEPKWINFSFKENETMNKNQYVIIKENSPLFSLVIKNKELIKKILKEYDEK